VTSPQIVYELCSAVVERLSLRVWFSSALHT